MQHAIGSYLELLLAHSTAHVRPAPARVSVEPWKCNGAPLEGGNAGPSFSPFGDTLGRAVRRHVVGPIDLPLPTIGFSMTPTFVAQDASRVCMADNSRSAVGSGSQRPLQEPVLVNSQNPLIVMLLSVYRSAATHKDLAR
jgi:hypothetical protein